MIDVNAATKTAYLSDSTHKIIKVVFPELSLEYTNDDLVSQSLELKESICEGNIEFVGCIASEFSITIRNLTDDVKGKKVNVSISVANTTEIPLFSGYVYEVELAAEKRHKKIKAYDVLYNLSQVDVALWYTELNFPITLKDFRDSLFEELGIEQETASLPNDNFSILRRFSPTALCALDVIKSLCQINGVFGRINRSGNFEYMNPSDGGSQTISYYKSASYQEFTVKPADKVVVDYDGVSGTYGGGTNVYTIQNNMFASGLNENEMQELAEYIYNNVYQFSYQPFKCNVNGLPFIECLDSVTMDVVDLESSEMQTITFRVLSRTMTGILSLRDNYFAEGDEFQHLFTSDIGTKIDELKRQVEIIRNDMDNLKFSYYLLTTDEDIPIGDDETKTLIDMHFTARKESVVTFNCEIILDVETTVDGDDYYDAVGKITYTYNNIEIGGYYPTETWQDGKHLLHLFYSIVVQDTSTNHFVVEMNMQGGSALIKAADLKGAIYGQNLAAADEWNGIIPIEERAPGFDLEDVSIADASDAVTILTLNPEIISNTDTVTSFDLIELPIAEATDSALAVVHTDSYRRVTEDGDVRRTEDDDTRYTEGD